MSMVSLQHQIWRPVKKMAIAKKDQTYPLIFYRSIVMSKTFETHTNNILQNTWQKHHTHANDPWKERWNDEFPSSGFLVTPHLEQISHYPCNSGFASTRIALTVASAESRIELEISRYLTVLFLFINQESLEHHVQSWAPTWKISWQCMAVRSWPLTKQPGVSNLISLRRCSIRSVA